MSKELLKARFGIAHGFDFNVVIRSIALDAKQGVASAHVGGAITLLSIPEREYEECLLKAESLLQSAAGSGSNQ